MPLFSSDQTRKGDRPARTQALLAAAGLLAAGLAFTTSYAYAQFKLPKSTPTTTTIDPTKPPPDNGRCEVTQEARDAWIKRSTDLIKLEQAFKDAYAALGSAPDNMFGYSLETTDKRLLDARQKQISDARDKARDTLLKQGNKLYEWAQKYASYQLKSCEDCELFNKWGILANVALSSAISGGTGSLDGSLSKPASGASLAISHNVKTLSKAQVEDDAVQAAAQAYLNNISAWQAADPAPAFLTVTLSQDLDTCRASFSEDTGRVNPKSCNKTSVHTLLDGWRNDLVDALTAADIRTPSAQRVQVADVWRRKNPSLRCDPPTNFPEYVTIDFALKRWGFVP